MFTPARLAIVRSALWLTTAIAMIPGESRAQALPGIEEYARAVAGSNAPRWAGQRVDWPLEGDRPDLPIVARAFDAPLAVHAAAGTSDAAAEAAMRGARRMHDALLARGYGRVSGDGDLGGGPELDLYLASSSAAFTTVSDGPTPYRFLDGIVDHVVLDRSLGAARLEACAAEAYADALLAQLDPAESPAMRRSVAAALAYSESGVLDGCEDDVVSSQRRPYAGILAPGTRDAAATLFLIELARRGDGGSGSFLRETWTMARQRTWDGERLRGSPDLVEAIGTSARLVGGSLDRTLVDFAVSRLGIASMRLTGMPALSPDERPPIAFEGRFDALPIRTAAHVPAIEPTGSAYARIDVAEPTDARLRVFLRGESYARWSLVAVALDANGIERARVRAPIEDREPNAYLAVELAGVRTVYVIVTNLGLERADPDVVTTNARTFSLLFDSARD